MIKIDVLTLFPNMFKEVFESSIIGRAQLSGFLHINYINIRDYSEDKHKRVDDSPYGGGVGMVMKPEPIYNAWKAVSDEDSYVIYMSPQGRTFTQGIARELSGRKHIIILCGHYEGVDQRIIDEIVDEEISIGDYVLTGGEIPAMAVVDAVARLVPGVLEEEAHQNDSHSDGLLEHPQYTRPAKFMGRGVPEVLLSGDHKKIEEWKMEQMVAVTRSKRPDIL